MPFLTMAAITAFKPGQSPPPVKIPIRIASLLKKKIVPGPGGPGGTVEVHPCPECTASPGISARTTRISEQAQVSWDPHWNDTGQRLGIQYGDDDSGAVSASFAAYVLCPTKVGEPPRGFGGSAILFSL